MRVALISCCKNKNNEETLTRKVYCSDLFLKTLTFCEKRYSQIYVLSAKFGLLELDQEISNYDLTLNSMTKKEREDWAKMVFNQIDKIKKGVVFDFYCGKNYYENLIKLFEENSIEYSLPFGSRGIGERLRDLKYENILCGDFGQ